MQIDTFDDFGDECYEYHYENMICALMRNRKSIGQFALGERRERDQEGAMNRRLRLRYLSALNGVLSPPFQGGTLALMLVDSLLVGS